MKIKFFTLALLLLTVAFQITAYGGEIIGDKAELNGEVITVSGKINGYDRGDMMTIMASEVINNSYSIDTTIYMDQTEPKVSSDGSFTVSFNINKALKLKGVYLVRLGGTNINEPCSMVLINNNRPVLILGDVDMDDVITSADAALTLQYVLFAVEDLYPEQINAMRVSGSLITSNNAADILYKTIYDSYVFPAER